MAGALNETLLTLARQGTVGCRKTGAGKPDRATYDCSDAAHRRHEAAKPFVRAELREEAVQAPPGDEAAVPRPGW